MNNCAEILFGRLFHSFASATLKAFSPAALLVQGMLKVLLLSLSVLLYMLERVSK